MAVILRSMLFIFGSAAVALDFGEAVNIAADDIYLSGSLSLLQIRATKSVFWDGVINPDQWPEVVNRNWTYDVNQSVKLVAWTGQFATNDMIINATIPNCKFEYLSIHSAKFREGANNRELEFVTQDEDTDISDADVVLFYLPYLKHWGKVLPKKKREGQLWIATCGEPLERPETSIDCSLAEDEEVMSHMDGLASYHQWADYPTYNDPPDEELMRRPPPDFAARGSEIATVTISDCQSSSRGRWFDAVAARFKELGRENALLAYGKCNHNSEEPPKEGCKEEVLSHWYDWFSNRCGSRPFKLVAENKIEPWYVTEKVWDAFAEGAIPVYWGTSEVKKLVPPGSILYFDDYSSPEELVDVMLNFSAADFAKARAWKDLPSEAWGGYLQARRDGHFTLLPRLCEAGAASKAARTGTATEAPAQDPRACDLTLTLTGPGDQEWTARVRGHEGDMFRVSGCSVAGCDESGHCGKDCIADGQSEQGVNIIVNQHGAVVAYGKCCDESIAVTATSGCLEAASLSSDTRSSQVTDMPRDELRADVSRTTKSAAAKVSAKTSRKRYSRWSERELLLAVR